jgi:uncharacterized lipoprotein YehR (DUF1307 family)
LELNGIKHLLIYSDDVNTLEEDINTININTETLLQVSKEVGVEVNTEKTKYVVMSRHHM